MNRPLLPYELVCFASDIHTDMLVYTHLPLDIHTDIRVYTHLPLDIHTDIHVYTHLPRDIHTDMFVSMYSAYTYKTKPNMHHPPPPPHPHPHPPTNCSRENIAKSDAFAAQNSLPRYKYVLHPKVVGLPSERPLLPHE